MVEAGTLRHRVDVELESGSTSDGEGNTYKTWAAVYSGLPAFVRPRLSRERVVADRSVPLGTHEVTMRYFSGLTTDHRLKFGTRYLSIAGIVNVDEANRLYELDCTEGIA